MVLIGSLDTINVAHGTNIKQIYGFIICVLRKQYVYIYFGHTILLQCHSYISIRIVFFNSFFFYVVYFCFEIYKQILNQVQNEPF